MLILEFCERGSLDTLLTLMATQMDVNFLSAKSMDTLTPENNMEQQQSQVQSHHELTSSSSPQQCNKNINDTNSSNVSSQVTHILRGVACGMHYLADEGYVHKVSIAR